MTTDKKQSFITGLKKIHEKAKKVNFNEDKILAQVMCIMSCLSFIGFDMAFLYQQVQTHGFNVSSMIHGTTWEQLATVYLLFAGADASMHIWAKLFGKMKNNIKNRIQDEKNQAR